MRVKVSEKNQMHVESSEEMGEVHHDAHDRQAT